MQEQKYPNGRQILILLACCGMVTSAIGLCVNAYGVFFTPICKALGQGRAAVTLHSTISGLLVGFLSPVVVKLTRKISVRKITCFGILLCSLSFVLMAMAKSIWMLNLCGILRGIGCSCFYSPLITMILGNWFKKGQSTVVGLSMSFAGISGAVLSPILNRSLEMFGYPMTSLFCAGFIIVSSLPLCALFLALDPQEVGERAYGETVVEKEKREKRKVNIFSVCSLVFLLMGIMTFLLVSVTGLTSHLSSYAESIQAGSEVGALMISAVMIGNIFSKFSAGYLCDKIGVVKTNFLMTFISLVGLLAMRVSNNVLLLLGSSFLFGAVYASSAVGLPSLVRFIYGSKQYGDAYALISLVAVAAPSISMVVSGWLFDISGNYGVIITMFSVCLIVAIILMGVSYKVAESRNTMEETV